MILCTLGMPICSTFHVSLEELLNQSFPVFVECPKMIKHPTDTLRRYSLNLGSQWNLLDKEKVSSEHHYDILLFSDIMFM